MGRRAAKTEGVKVEWRALPDATEQAVALVKAHHPHLSRARLVCLGRPKTKRGASLCETTRLRLVTKATNAMLRAVDPLGRQYDLAIEVGQDVWARADATQRTIMLDHALCHAGGQDQRGGWTLRREHDVDEFLAVIQRHGPYSPALRGFAKEARQMDLGLGD